MGKISTYFRRGKIRLADRLAWVMVTDEELVLAPGWAMVTSPEKGEIRRGQEYRSRESWELGLVCLIDDYLVDD